MLYLNRKFLLLLLLFLQGCAPLDNYMLGKDNAPTPKPLKPLNNKATLVKQWTTSANTSPIHGYLKLKPIIKDNIVYTASPRGW